MERHSASVSMSSTYTRNQSIFKTSYHALYNNKAISKQLLELTLDNLRLIQLSGKLLTYVKLLNSPVSVDKQD